MTPTEKLVRLVASGSLLAVVVGATSVWVFIAPVRDGAQSSEAALDQRLQPNAAGVGEREPSPVQRVRLFFTYPQRLRENETGVITLRYQRIMEQRKGYAATAPTVTTEVRKLDRDVVANLTSSGFKVSPESSVKREKDTPLPLIFKWTITPEKEGDHPVVLDVSQLLLFASPKLGDQLTTEFSLNGALAPMRDEGYVDLPIVVTTQWGVSQVMVSLAGALVALIAFVVSYPVLTDWLKRRTGISTGA